nr:two-component response regulator ORR33-like [Setaria viridis]
MEDDMAAMFPNGIRTLIVDDDAKFLKSASRLLSILNFDVVVCSNVAYALKSLTNGNLEGFDVILVHAAKAAACGFNFRAIVEANLLIPVIYFLPQDHEATGDEAADELLRALQAGTYVIKRPVDTNEVRSLLWKVIAYRKCELETQARRGGTGGEAGLDVAGEDEDRVHFKVIKGASRKRKGSSSNPGGSSAGTTAAAGGHPAAKGEEKDNAASLQQPAQQKHGRGKKAQKNGGGEAFKLLQPNKAMMNGPQLNQHQPKPSLFVHPVFRTLGVLPYKSKFFSDAAGASSNAGTFAGAGNASALPAAQHHVYSAAPSPLPPAAHSIVFGNNMPPATAPTMAAAATATYEPRFSQVIGNQQPPDVHPLLMFGPFPYQGPPRRRRL